MKYLLLTIFGVLIVMSFVADRLSRKHDDDSKTPLVWVSDGNPARQEQIKIYNGLYKDNFLQLDPDNGGTMKVIVQCSANMGPDLIDHINENTFQTYHAAGVLLDVTDVAPKMGFGLDTLAPTIRPLVQMETIINEKDVNMDDPKDRERLGDIVLRQYAYPCNVYHTYLFYNKNVFDRLNIPYPKEDITWDEYIALAKKLTVMRPGSNIPEVFGAAGVNIDTLIWGWEGEHLNKDGTRSADDSEAVLNAMTMFHTMMHKDQVEPSPVLQAGVQAQGGFAAGFISWFGEGKIGMYWGARWMLIQFRRFQEEQRKAHERWEKDGRQGPEPQVLRYGVINVPHFPGKPIYSQMGARNTGINVRSHHKEAALTFLQYLASADYAKIINDDADSKPGNQKYYQLALMRNPRFHDDGEEDAHRFAISNIPNGRCRSRSVFVQQAVIDRAFNDVTSKIKAEPDLTRDDIAKELKNCATRINKEITRNIKRDPNLRRAYEKMLKKGAEPIVIPFEEVN